MEIQNSRILIIEDDSKIIQLLKLHLTDNDYRVKTAENGKQALKKIEDNDYDLVILDIMLPFINGFQICQVIRQQNKKVPILMLTAMADENDKVRALELGADDYLVKPFGIRELMARVKALLRRTVNQQNSTVSMTNSIIRHGALEIDLEKRTAQINDEQLDLTTKEFDLLALFTSHPGKAYSRGELLSLVWGYGFQGYEHTVNTHINRLRSKIEKTPTKPKLIKTVWGHGYKLEENLNT